MRLRHLLALVTLSVLFACGDDGAVVQPDAAESTTQDVVLRARGTVLIAVREGDGPWRAVDRGVTDDVTITVVKGPFVVASVCDDPGYFNYYLNYGGTGTSELFLYCSDPTSTVNVTANAGTATVYVGYFPISSGSTFPIAKGTYDVVAVDDTTSTARFEIRRDVAIMADTTLTFDLAQTGRDMRAVPLTHDAAPSESVTGITRLVLAGGGQPYVLTTTNQLWVFPPSALLADERQYVSASARATTPASRSASKTIDGNETAIALTFPPGLTSASLTLDRAPRATWQVASDWNDHYVYTFSPDFTKLWDARVYPEYIAAKGQRNELAFADPTELPGWKPAWNLASLAGYEWSLLLFRGLSPSERQSVTWSETLPGGAPFAPRKHSLRRARLSDR